MSNTLNKLKEYLGGIFSSKALKKTLAFCVVLLVFAEMVAPLSKIQNLGDTYISEKHAKTSDYQSYYSKDDSRQINGISDSDVTSASQKINSQSERVYTGSSSSGSSYSTGSGIKKAENRGTTETQQGLEKASRMEEIPVQTNPVSPIQDPEDAGMPSQTFSGRAGSIVINVEADEDTFPAGTRMRVKVVYDQSVIDSVAQCASEGARQIEAVDITFYDKKGNEIEPLKPVRVSMASEKIRSSESTQVVHVDNSGNAESVSTETTAAESQNEVTFDSHSFSVYALVFYIPISEPEEDPTVTDEPAEEPAEDPEITDEPTEEPVAEPAITEEPAEETTDEPAEEPVIPEEEEGPKYYTRTYEGDNYSIELTYSEEALIPEDTVLAVYEILPGTEEYDIHYAAAAYRLGVSKRGISYARFFDIRFEKDGVAIEPLSDVSVKITYNENAEIGSADKANIVHFGEEEAEVIDTDETGSNREISFSSDSFSVYSVIYTVDFHWEVDGEVFQYSIPGGGYISLSALLDILGITDSSDPEAAESFLADVESVEFSDPDLVWVGKIDETSTVGEIKTAYGLDTEYSAELTEEQRNSIDAQTAESGYWALISLRPFDSEESLTVSMKDGEKFEVRVTDAQITRKYISVAGDTYLITVTYTEKAEIPDDADLRVKEILSDEEYRYYLSESAKILGVSDDEISFARFFDISIIDTDGKKIEPRIPVEVEIQYLETLNPDDMRDLRIVHFADEGVEVIDDIELCKESTSVVYLQSSFSVTATVITSGDLPVPNQMGTQYAVIIEDPQTHKYYVVENDGRLEEAQYDPETNQVTIDYPLEWTYISAHDGLDENTEEFKEYRTDQYGNPIAGNAVPYWDPYNLRIAADARSYDQNQLPKGYYYRYISPVSPNGIDEESTERDHGSRYGWASLDGHKWTNGLRYADKHIFDIHWDNNQGTNVSNGYYIGADFENMHITGLQPEENAAIIHMAQVAAADIPPLESNNETVSHIDVAVGGNGFLDVPLAYGPYYYKEGEELKPAYTVSSGNDKTLHLEKIVPIDKKDIMNAKIYALDNQGEEVPNAYQVTGYSANESNVYSNNLTQVRIEGVFKVTKLEPYQPTWWGDRSNDNEGRRRERLKPENQIFYYVVVEKDVTFDLVDPEYGQLYDAEGNRLTVTVNLSLSDGFSYWDERNECPPLIGCDENGQNSFEQNYSGLFGGENIDQIKGRNNRNWKNGAIIDNDWGGDPKYIGDSGMDFILGNDKEANPNILAVEVVKVLMDEEGNRINPDHTITNKFSLYHKPDKNQGYAGTSNSVHDLAVDNPIDSARLQSDGYYADYSHQRDFNIKIYSDDSNGINSGMGVFYDYSVKEGMYYIVEDDEPVLGENIQITDTNQRKWKYKETKVETEYVWRNNAYNGKKHHVIGYTSIPELLGTYTTDAPYFNDDGVQTSNARNGFLEFYVYNIYEPKTYPVYIKKTDNVNPSAIEGLKGAEFDLYGPYTEGEVNASGFSPELPEKKLNSASIVTTDNIVKIGDLSEGIYYLFERKAPEHYKLLSNPVVITVDSTKEDAEAVSYSQGETSTYTANDIYITKDTENHDLDEPYHQLIITDEAEPIELDVQKEWSDSSTVDHSNDIVEYRLYRIPQYGNIEYESEEVTYAEGFTGRISYDSDPMKSWREKVSNLPRTGVYTPQNGTPVTVTYRYYVAEEFFEGYKSDAKGEFSQDGNIFTVTLTNTPNSSFDLQTEVNVSKKWKDASGAEDTSSHENDSITFRMIQKKYLAKGTFQGRSLFVYPIRVILINGDNSVSGLSKVYYVPAGYGFDVTASCFFGGALISNTRVRGSGFDSGNNTEFGNGHTFSIANVNGPREVTLELCRNERAKWSTSIGRLTWTAEVSNSGNRIYTEEQLSSILNTSGTPIAIRSFDYSMRLNESKNDTVLTPPEGAQGKLAGNGIWSGKISELPFYEKGDSNNVFYVYVYEVSEVKIGSESVVVEASEGFNGHTSKYMVKWSKDSDGNWIITNQMKPTISITVKKVAQAEFNNMDAKGLSGATFVLEKYTDASYQDKDTSWVEQTIADEDNDVTGVFCFNELLEGYYKLNETVCPPGYVSASTAPKFKVEKRNGELVVVLLNEYGTEITSGKMESVKIENAVITVANTPGTVLPSTGGAGNSFSTFIGLLLILLACAGFFMNKRKNMLWL